MDLKIILVIFQAPIVTYKPLYKTMKLKVFDGFEVGIGFQGFALGSILWRSRWL